MYTGRHKGTIDFWKVIQLSFKVSFESIQIDVRSRSDTLKQNNFKCELIPQNNNNVLENTPHLRNLKNS